MWSNAKYRASQKGIPFTITQSDIVIPDECPVFGIPFDFDVGAKGGGPWSPSLDRIVPEKGYVPGNIQVVSKKFNIIKQDATPDDLGVAAVFMLKQSEESNRD